MATRRTKSRFELPTRFDYACPKTPGYRRKLQDRSHAALPIRCLESRCRRDGSGIRPLLWNEGGVFRGGCLTGPGHSGVELHGFLSYLVKVAVSGQTYTVFGYKGKQVRDNIHSHDVVRAFEEFARNPRPGEVYNMGGGRENSVSILEAIDLVQDMIGSAYNGFTKTRRAKATISAIFPTSEN